MKTSSNCRLDTVRERDVDIIMLGAFFTDKGFIKLFSDKVNLDIDKIEVTDVEISKRETDLGETDVCVITNIDGKKHAFLIEDKIDAIAMPNQHERYLQRGEKGVCKNEYESFDVFIFCPEKYLSSNSEAKLYENCITYEEAVTYFKSSENSMAEIWMQILEQALDKAKRPSEVILDERANQFTIEYKKYIREYYQEIDIKTKDSANGYWMKVGAKGKNSYILHKIPQGYVDLTISNKAGEIDTAYNIARWLREETGKAIIAEVTGKALAFRIYVPILNMYEPFEVSDENDVRKCCEAISTLIRLSELFSMVSNINM